MGGRKALNVTDTDEVPVLPGLWRSSGGDRPRTDHSSERTACGERDSLRDRESDVLRLMVSEYTRSRRI